MSDVNGDGRLDVLEQAPDRSWLVNAIDPNVFMNESTFTSERPKAG